jgi:hypothetical protein
MLRQVSSSSKKLEKLKLAYRVTHTQVHHSPVACTPNKPNFSNTTRHITTRDEKKTAQPIKSTKNQQIKQINK